MSDSQFKIVEKNKKYLVKHKDVSKELVTLTVSDKLTKTIECKFNIRNANDFCWITEKDFNEKVLEVIEEIPTPKNTTNLFDFEEFDDLFKDAKAFGNQFSNLFKTTSVKYEKKD